MSEAIKVAMTAPNHVEELIKDLLDGDHKDNYVLLGSLCSGEASIQVQLHVMQDETKFIDEYGCRLIEKKLPALATLGRSTLEQMLIHQPEKLLEGIQELQTYLKRDDS
ncbi:hypothetical protein MHM95_06195 [Pseudoalteromonas sp. CnMc7-15]|uniref:hypothetical protein n=1 Tax=unclassified Pseudoalteromonas TaxID=194690 RepID=UPI001EF45AA7|nr:hypothetical protein [Pseudoalteromonas sp. CnMc7-15]MCG7565877.1 hypothetical protein [Pseudoalteromonas sp. CnMc7-15]